MARIAGIQIEKNAKGVPTKVTIDLKKHGALFTPLLEQVGAIEEDEFERKWRAGGYTVEQARDHLHNTIAALPWKKQA